MMALGECLVMASHRPIYTFQLTGYATESNENKYICCFMRATHAINNIYKLICFFELILLNARASDIS